MADLSTNYYDDILSESMNGKKKFRLTYRNGTTEEVTIEDISEYDQYGSKFGAGDINKTNQAVNEKFDSGDVVDPMIATEKGFAADAKFTRDAIDKINKNLNDSMTIKFNSNNEYVPTSSNGNFLMFKLISNNNAFKNRWSIKFSTYTTKYITTAKQWIELGTVSSGFGANIIFHGYVCDQNSDVIQNAIFKIKNDGTLLLYIPDELLAQNYSFIIVNTQLLIG